MLKFEIFKQNNTWKIRIIDQEQNSEKVNSFLEEPSIEELLNLIKIISKLEGCSIFIDFTNR